MGKSDDLNLLAWSDLMKRDWNERARQHAMWFANKAGTLNQSDEAFYESGAAEIRRVVLDDLDLVTRGRDPKTIRVLEMGCGIGRMTKALATIFGEVHATDVSGEMISRARERLSSVGNAHFYETNGYDLSDLPDEHFDVVLPAFVFQHVPSEEIIRSNLRDALRVLRPDGILRFQTNSLTTFGFQEIENDTWLGASFPEASIRDFARRSGSQLIGIAGCGTRDCWTTLRKPGVEERGAVETGKPAVEWHTGASGSKLIPAYGEHASLTVVASGLIGRADANNVVVEILGEQVWPSFVGPVRKSVLAGLSPSLTARARDLVQIDLDLPLGCLAGKAGVRLRIGSLVSDEVTIDLHEPQPVTPRISAVVNGADFSKEIQARGEKSRLCVSVEGLDETADTGNIRLRVGSQIVKPSYVGRSARSNLYQVFAQLPVNTQPGDTDLRLVFGNVESPKTRLTIAPNHT